jgi:RNA polymerase sigma-70 factor (ECF subfamily)
MAMFRRPDDPVLPGIKAPLSESSRDEILTPAPKSAPEAHRNSMDDELLRHLDAAYNLARWLSRNAEDAQDIVQESFLRALRSRDQCRQESVRAWLLKIVRNTCHTWLTSNRTRSAPLAMLDTVSASDSASPEAAVQRRQDAGVVRRAIEALPDEFREVIVLRELEGLPYKEIAEIEAVPIGTVMSRLSRARARLKELLADYGEEAFNEL